MLHTVKKNFFVINEKLSIGKIFKKNKRYSFVISEKESCGISLVTYN